MKTTAAIHALDGLAHEHRLAIYRLLVQRGPEGLPAGTIGQRVGLLPSSLTFHLQNLQRAGLISQRRESRQLIYSADFAAMDGLIGYLTENCSATAALPVLRAARRPRPSRPPNVWPKLRSAPRMSEPLLIRGRPPRSTATALLQAQGLPASDITDAHLENFFYVGSDSSPTGLIGLELYDADALLRSLVVDERARSKNLGARLVRHAEQYAASKCVRSIHLLTTTAESFFQRLGYELVDRSRAPPSIQQTREFASLCPASSAFMVKSL